MLRFNPFTQVVSCQRSYILCRLLYLCVIAILLVFIYVLVRVLWSHCFDERVMDPCLTAKDS